MAVLLGFSGLGELREQICAHAQEEILHVMLELQSKLKIREHLDHSQHNGKSDTCLCFSMSGMNE